MCFSVVNRKAHGRYDFPGKDLTNLSGSNRAWGMSVKLVPMTVKIMHSKSSHKINIPIALAKEVGFDKAEYALVVSKGNNKLEIKRYDKEEDIIEYVQGAPAISN